MSGDGARSGAIALLSAPNQGMGGETGAIPIMSWSQGEKGDERETMG